MKKLNTIEKVILVALTIIIISFLILVIKVALNYNSNNKFKSNISTHEGEYVSNNEYNSDFDLYDIDKSENAFYDKYTTPTAQQKLLNQKINIEIKSIEKLEEIDEGSATTSKKTYIFALKDYDNNTWLSISNHNLEDNSYNIKIKDNLILYGKYLGIIEYNQKQYPQIDIAYVYKNLDKLDISTYTKITDNYINLLHTLYPQESFSFKEMSKDTGYNELVYTNQNNDLTITIIVDDGLIKMTDLLINNIDFDINTIDKDFILAFIKAFNTNITNPDEYLQGAINNLSTLKSNLYDSEYKYTPFALNNIIADCGINTSSLCLYYDL